MLSRDPHTAAQSVAADFCPAAIIAKQASDAGVKGILLYSIHKTVSESTNGTKLNKIRHSAAMDISH